MLNYRILILSIIVLSFLFNCSEDYSTNPTGIETVLIPAGTFQMGNTGAYSGGYADDEKPVHEVTITKSFYIGKYEVTQAQWKAVMEFNPSWFKGDNLPVEQVFWFDAVEFCNKLSEKEGLTKCYTINGRDVTCNWDENGWRLPTEAEWEYACKAGSSTDIYIGNLTNSLCTPIDSNLDKIGWYCGNSDDETHPVGQKQANSFGLYDMIGNVWEWSWDWYDSNYYTDSAVTDPRGADSGTYRVLRGGSWNQFSENCRGSKRYYNGPVYHFYGYLGFRICRTK